MLSDEQRKQIEQIIDGRATTRPLDDGTIKASRWIHAGAAEDIAKRLCPLIEQWISEAAAAALDANRCDDQVEGRLRERIADVRGEHIASLLRTGGTVCFTCLQPWPCRTFEALLSVEALLSTDPTDNLTREEWSAAYIGETPDGTRTIRLIGTEGDRSHAEAERADCSRDDPDTRFVLVRRTYTEWQEVTE